MSRRSSECWLDAAALLLGETGGEGRLEVLGESMLPHLRPGESIWIDFAPAKYHSGEIVVFQQAGALLVHRIVFRKGRHFRIRGDNASRFDGPTPPTAILGLVVAFEREGCWYSLKGVRARSYAKLVALHSFFWIGLGTVVERVRPGSRLRDLLVRADAFALRLACFVAFRACHRIRTPPAILDDPAIES